MYPIYWKIIIIQELGIHFSNKTVFYGMTEGFGQG